MCVVTSKYNGDCPTERTGAPILVEHWSIKGHPFVARGYVITEASVVRVGVGRGSTVPTRHDIELPAGLRYAYIEVKRGKYLWPHFVAYATNGTQLSVSKRVAPALAYLELPTYVAAGGRNWRRNGCRITTHNADGVVISGGSAITMMGRYHTLGEKGFVACASVSYTWRGWSLLAGVLVNASDPGAMPFPLPGAKLMKGHPGIVEAPGFEGPMVGRSIKGGWLLVAKGANTQQRLELLNHINATVAILAGGVRP